MDDLDQAVVDLVQEQLREDGLVHELAALVGQLPVQLLGVFEQVELGAEAFELASFLDEPELQAWTRATQSLIEYYSGNYHDALAYAQDGQRCADGGGRQRIRLLLNGEARALARLGDVRGVDHAVNRGFELLQEQPPSAEVGVSLDLNPYTSARVAGNAATAYLLIRRPREVTRLATEALAVFDEADLPGPRALTRLDHATALLMGEQVDLRTLPPLRSKPLWLRAQQALSQSSNARKSSCCSLGHGLVSPQFVMSLRSSEPSGRNGACRPARRVARRDKPRSPVAR